MKPRLSKDETRALLELIAAEPTEHGHADVVTPLVIKVATVTAAWQGHSDETWVVAVGFPEPFRVKGDLGDVEPVIFGKHSAMYEEWLEHNGEDE